MITDPTTAHIVHYFFEWTALIVGLFVYRQVSKKQNLGGLLRPGQFAVAIGCLLGAAIGNKLMFWAENPLLWKNHFGDFRLWLEGQSIVGGLLGGWLGVEIGKRLSGITERTGDRFVLPILCGILVGRIGCFLAGLNDGTYGTPTDMPWGFDFGDGIPRHPTQLYEWLLAFTALLTWPRWHRRFAHTPGLTFRVLILGYLLWRLLIDALKPIPYVYPGGISGIQWACLIGSVVIVVGLVRDKGKQKNV